MLPLSMIEGQKVQISAVDVTTPSGKNTAR